MQKLLQKLRQRKYSYRRLFLTEDGKLNPDGEKVIADLKRFCRANASTAQVSPIRGAIDPIAMALAEGRREVFLRITAHLYLDDKVMLNLKEDDGE